MFSILIAIIYLLFISMGLPDSLLGAAWPSMAQDMGMGLSPAGIISMTISASTIISSLFSDKLIKRLGTGKVSAMSVMLTAFALLGFSITEHFAVLCILAIPYGLGAGAVDVAINDYVALNFSSKHMKRLHCFWGIGAALGSYIMGYAIKATSDPRAGYSIVSAIQIILTVLLFSTLSMWKNQDQTISEDSVNKTIGIKEALSIRGVKSMLFAFFGYCALESTAGLWASSYLAGYRGFDPHEAAAWASVLYIGITFGRFVGGFLPDKTEDRQIIRVGEGLMVIGIALMMFSKVKSGAIVGLFLIGLGASPVYPSLIHTTPRRFGRENSTRIVGIQMASAYVGSTLIPPLFGVSADLFSIELYPFFLLFFIVLLILMTEKANRIFIKR